MPKKPLETLVEYRKSRYSKSVRNEATPCHWKEVRMMKRIISLLIAAVLLLGLLAGCQPVPDDPTDGTTTIPETTDTIPSSDPEETTEPIPSSDPEETTEPPKLGDIGSSTLAPEHLLPFIYDGRNPSAWWVADTEQCVIGGLYVAHKGETGKTVQIASEEILLYDSCEDHILYVTKAEPQKVVQTDYSGQSHTVIYEAVHGDIVCLEYYDKVGQKGQLVTLEGNGHVVLTDIASSEAEVLMVQEDIIAVSLGLYGRQGLIQFRKADYSPWFYNTQTGELVEDTSL